MIEIDIPGIKKIYAEHLVLDYNGTVAEDGKVIPGVADILNSISDNLEVHVITADTFGKAAAELKDVKCTLDIIGKGNQQKQKLDFITSLGPDKVIAAGNGFNDMLMLNSAALGIAIIQKEGASAKTVAAADIIVTSINDALGLILNPLRIAATLRG
jgi:soluble P-type ATPase